MEGWYFKVAMPDTGDAVALIYSYEQGLQPDGAPGRLGMQAMGPEDTYAAQCTTDTRAFWADRNQLRLGACFEPTASAARDRIPKQMMVEAAFDEAVAEGFQASETWHQGRIANRPDTCLADVPGDVPWVRWAFSVRAVYGWGSAEAEQRSTAGWLASLPVLEPHWQVLVSHGLASGFIEWGPDKRLDFEDAPFYSEKNWGDGFPQKWAWLQCNTFPRRPDLALTAVGARRNLLNVPGLDEVVGLLGIHFDGDFVELEPASSEVSWRVAPWGSWRFAGKGDRYEAVAEATCSTEAGQVLRAPTGAPGLVPVCKDSFSGRLRLRVWRLTRSGIRAGGPIIDEATDSAAVEVGGGPWWGEWSEAAAMNPAVAAAMRLPLEQIGARLGSVLPAGVRQRAKPPGY